MSLISQAESLLAAGQSLRGKLHRGLELTCTHSKVGVTSLSPDVDAEIAASAEVMLETPELVINHPLKSLVGVAMRGLLAAQTTIPVCVYVEGQEPLYSGHHWGMPL